MPISASAEQTGEPLGSTADMGVSVSWSRQLKKPRSRMPVFEMHAVSMEEQF